MTTPCPTTAGTYRCKHDAGHTGDCEADSLEYARAQPAPPSLESRVESLEKAVARLIQERVR